MFAYLWICSRLKLLLRHGRRSICNRAVVEHHPLSEFVDQVLDSGGGGASSGLVGHCRRLLGLVTVFGQGAGSHIVNPAKGKFGY